MIIDILTIFPGFFEGPLRESILGKAIQEGLVKIRVHNLREFTEDRHRTVDDRPFGGGAGMVMKPEPIVRALESLQAEKPQPRIILLTPRGYLFNQVTARRWSLYDRIVLICGRYEGVDERVSFFVNEEISIGDYILSGGEAAAVVVVDALVRLIPGVLGNKESSETESFERGLIEYPQYTRPRSFRGYEVPEVLISGNHERVRKWRILQSLLLTRERRPDLFAKVILSREEKELLEKFDRFGATP
ncbi:MAG: tRNA (guanosine(37)-N1)-methyltransferase TrmD [Syntrophobacterales bacterium]|nr:tRNA (guanosine(37)-N1)-methyltransferase TrmD [Syntrophobacterales bacterium]